MVSYILLISSNSLNNRLIFIIADKVDRGTNLQSASSQVENVLHEGDLVTVDGSIGNLLVNN